MRVKRVKVQGIDPEHNVLRLWTRAWLEPICPIHSLDGSSKGTYLKEEANRMFAVQLQCALISKALQEFGED